MTEYLDMVAASSGAVATAVQTRPGLEREIAACLMDAAGSDDICVTGPRRGRVVISQTGAAPHAQSHKQ